MQLPKTSKTLSVFSLMMINIIAVDSLKTLPIGAEYGLSVIFYYALAAICFFIPTALVTAELATAWPNTGGVYVWVTKAFGSRTGFLTIWLQWIYTVVWYPTILAFLAGTLAYLINPALSNNTTYMLVIILTLFWGATGLNCLGIKISSRISIIGAVVGTLIPLCIIIVLGLAWIIQSHPVSLVFTEKALFPGLGNIKNIGFFAAILFGLMGMEMSAVHAGDVKNPQKDYPRALLYSALIILITLIGGSLSIALIISPAHINLVSSLIDAYAIFLNYYGLGWMTPIIVAMIFLSALSGVCAWVIGPTRGLWVAACQEPSLKYFSKLNAHGIPTRILILQGLIVTALCAVFLCMSSVNNSYWILTALTSQLGLLFYIFMFAAVIQLRYKSADTPRAYKIPGGKIGVWCVAGLGILTSGTTILIGFLPPSNLNITHVVLYEIILVLGIVVFVLPPFFLKNGKTLTKVTTE